MSSIIAYLQTILPGLIIGIMLILLLARKSDLFRIIIYIMLFILIRDAMTPAGFWDFGSNGFFWIRFIDDPLITSLFGISSIVLVIFINKIDTASHSLINWIQGNRAYAFFGGLAGAMLVVAPLLIFYTGTPIEARGGTVAYNSIPFILIIAMGGNTLEEVLFRGYFQGYLEKELKIPKISAALGSGLFFGFCHIFLAYTVTSIGYPLVIFAVYEGIIASFVRMKFGVIASILTHGGAIFILASGIF